MKKVSVAWLALSFAVGIYMTCSVRAQEATAALEGLDPVLLTQGKDQMGLEKFAVKRGAYLYLFATAENKALFEKDPARYEIQMEGSCARMGPEVGGNPGVFTVHQGRIYIFGSDNCQKLFEAAPEKFIEAAAAPLEAMPEALQRGRMLIDKAVEAAGGAAKLDALTSYQEQGTVMTRNQQGPVEMKTALTRLYPASFRAERVLSFGTLTEVVTPAEAFVAFPRGSNPMRPAQRAAVEQRLRRNVLEALRARKEADFRAAALGPGKAGDAAVEQVAVQFGGVSLRLGLDPATGRVLSLAYRGRGRTSGEVGEVVQVFSDFRTVDGLTLPFKATGTFNGQPDADSSYTLTSVSLNGKVDSAAFAKPQ